MTFRYPELIPFINVDLRNLKSVMASLAVFLGSLAAFLEAAKDAKP